MKNKEPRLASNPMTETSIPETSRRSLKGIKTILISLVSNMVLAIVKVVTGVVGQSYALVADGVESALDVFSSSVVLGGLTIGARPPDHNHPYGHGKAESLAAMTVSLALIAVAGGPDRCCP